MRWKSKPYVEWERIFALIPHWCDDTKEWVWLEHVWRTVEGDLLSSFYFYRSAKP